ncbi:hypothetical protein BG51_23350 [Pseudomonas [fluorescens] ATCC 17400]|uniref:hypothetical protein n=1 Tax=Pseudomonas proteolytica TaxID=219574 RepID=UPI0004939D3F|nr:hypothetical protein [Pseudomonas proteolytica]MBC3336651.1 hypothetical protein [Pseudomonas proteolytica]
MLSQMPAGQNRSDLINYLDIFFKEFYVEENKKFNHRMVVSALDESLWDAWETASAVKHAFKYVSVRESFVWAVRRGAISAEALIDWIVINLNQGFTRQHIDYIEDSPKRKPMMEKLILITSIVDFMNSQSAFDPPYTPVHDFNFDAQCI